MKASDKTGTRVVVADLGEARFYDVGPASTLQIAGRLVDLNARLHDRDLVSDRGAVAHHATDGERSPRKHEATLFARRIAAELERARRQGRFERLVVIAGPPFLGELRTALPKSLRAMTVAEVAKDLVHHPESVVRTYVTQALAEARFADQRTP